MADTEPLVSRLGRMSGEGAFYVALLAAGLAMVALGFGFLDALDFMNPRTEYWRPAHAWAVLSAAPAAGTAAVALVAGLRAVVQRRRPGWGTAAACLALGAGMLAVAVLTQP